MVRESTSSGHPLPLTGERTLPGIPGERYWFLRHVVAYRLAGQFARTAGRVLDAGCGEGYGLAMLRAAGADHVVGVDLDPATVAHATRRYSASDPAIEVVGAELRAVPLPPHSVDLTVCLQVIEHVHDVPGTLTALRGLTRPGGLVLVGTPNRLTFSPSGRPTNPFHAVEFSPGELVEALTDAGLEVVELAGVHHAGELAAMERRWGAFLPDLLAATPAADWPGWLRDVVHRTREEWFRIGTDRLEASLDLLATCRVPGQE